MQPASANTRSGPRRLLALGLRLAVLAATLALLYALVDLSGLGERFARLSAWVIVGAVAICLARTWLTGLRWKLVNADASGQITHWQYFRYLMISYTFNLFMPGALGGDLARGVFVFKEVDRNRGSNVIAILVDRAIGLASILLMGALACVAAPQLPHRWTYMGILLVVIGLFAAAVVLAGSQLLRRIAAALFRRLGRAGQGGLRLLDVWHQALDYYKANPRRVAAALLLCAPIHVSWFVVSYLLALHIGIDISFLALATVTSLVWVASAVPITFSGIGVREISFVFLLGPLGVSAEAATAFGLSCFLTTVLLGLLGAPFVVLGRPRPAAAEAAPETEERNRT